MTTTSKKYFILLLIALVLCDAVICKTTNHVQKNYNKAKRANQKSVQTYNGDDNNIMQKRNHVNLNDDNDGKIGNYSRRRQQARKYSQVAINRTEAVTVSGYKNGVSSQVGESKVQIHSGVASVHANSLVAINRTEAVTVPGYKNGVRSQVGESKVQIHSGVASVNVNSQVAINRTKAVAFLGSETGVRSQVGESKLQIHSGVASVIARVQSGNSKISNVRQQVSKGKTIANLGTVKYPNSNASRIHSN